MKKYILASASPRRRELLAQIGLDFDILVSDADEDKLDKEALRADLYVEELALLKAGAAAKVLRERSKGEHIIISADTVVCFEGQILGKPKDQEDAFRMLGLLSGREHEVYTGICLMRLSDGFSVADFEKTTVTFHELSPEKIWRYIHSGEPMDKAGAYGIQERGAILIQKICGDYANVVGLPLAKLAMILEKDFSEEIL